MGNNLLHNLGEARLGVFEDQEVAVLLDAEDLDVVVERGDLASGEGLVIGVGEGLRGGGGAVRGWFGCRSSWVGSKGSGIEFL